MKLIDGQYIRHREVVVVSVAAAIAYINFHYVVEQSVPLSIIVQLVVANIFGC